MAHSADDIIGQCLAWQDEGLSVALATVIETWGSAPRPVGSQLGINENGDFVGSVSGGCIEGAVVEEALDAMETGQAKLLDYGVSNTKAWEVGLACGGKIQIYVDPVLAS